ncbi:MAG: LysM peptidoglycan-binding domain-containing protein [Pirellulaceae bacterium]
MDTLKTAAVVILLLAVLYGVYVVLNRPGSGLPDMAVSSSESGPTTPEIIIPEFPTPGGFQDGSAGPGDLQEVDPSELFNDKEGAASGFEVEAPPSFAAADVDSPAGDLELRFDAGTPDGASVEESAGGTYPGNSAEAAPAANLGAQNFLRDWDHARRQIEQGEYRRALESLTKYYQSPNLSSSQQQVLLDTLDALAGKVIYSTEPLLGEPLYVVRRNETLVEIARECNVPWRLLYNINGLRDPDVLLPNQQLKIVKGPFRCEVSLSRNQLTLFLGEMYAGRFDISQGDEPANPGAYAVRHVTDGRNYYSADSRISIPAGHPNNPYGEHFLDLGQGVSIHGSPMSGNGNLGCISLAPRDAKDVYGILSDGSTVTIRR